MKAVVRLQNLKIPTTGSYKLRAFIHPRNIPFDKDDPEFQHRYGVGYAALWKSHGVEHPHNNHREHPLPEPHHPTSCTIRFDVSKSMAHFSPEGATDLVLTLHYIPAPSPTGEPQSVPDLVKEIQLEDILLESYVQP